MPSFRLSVLTVVVLPSSDKIITPVEIGNPNYQKSRTAANIRSIRADTGVVRHDNKHAIQYNYFQSGRIFEQIIRKTVRKELFWTDERLKTGEEHVRDEERRGRPIQVSQKSTAT